MSVHWKDKSALEWLQILKEELERLGLDKDPSRVELQKVYNKEVMPSPTTYLGQLNKSWKEIINMIGLEYDQGAAKRAIGVNKGRPRKMNDKKEEKEFLLGLAKTLRKLGTGNSAIYNKNRNGLPTAQWYMLNIAPWKEVKQMANRLLEEEESK